MGQLEGKVAIVTGAGSNMGKAAATLFTSEGATVIVADRDVGRGSAVADHISSHFVRTDVTRSAEVDSLVRRTIQRFGKLDIIVQQCRSRELDADDGCR